MVKEMYLVGWKAIEKESPFSKRTLQYWSKTRKRIPVQKTTQSKQGNVVISRLAFLRWLGEVLYWQP